MRLFEFDEQKSKSNQKKHGINFLDAQELWLDPELIEIDSKCDEEIRKLVVGLIEDKHWSAIITYRNGKVRIISVRRSRQREVELYESL